MKKIKVRDSAEEFFSDSIDKLYSSFLRRLELCRMEYSEPGIHDFRVSIRKLMSLLFLISNFTDVPYLVELSKMLKKMLKSLNPVRDIQVEVMLMKQLIFKYPVLYTYYIHLLSHEIVLSEKTGTMMRDIDTDGIEGLIFFLKYYIRTHISDIGFDIDKIMIIKEMAFSELMGKFLAAMKTDTASIHKVRLALKKYRYIEEALQPLTGVTKAKIRKMKKLQDLLGEIQDNTVLLERINNFMQTQRIIPAKSYTEAVTYIEGVRSQAIDNLFLLKEDFAGYFAIEKDKADKKEKNDESSI